MLNKTRDNQKLYKNNREELNEMLEDIDDVKLHKNSKKNKSISVSTKKTIKNILMKIIAAILFIISAILLIICGNNLYQNVFNPDGYTGFFGIGEAIVASNSMDPNIQVNDLVFYKKVAIKEISKGDIVVYKKEDTDGKSVLVIHRINQINDNSFVSQGDNNLVEDNEMPTSTIVGKYIFKINKIGTILRPLSNTLTSIIIIAILVLVFILRILVYVLHKKCIIRKISLNNDTRSALDHFFDF